MNIWHDVRRDRIREEEFLAVVEIEKGSKVKYELDKETGLLVVDRVLFTSTHYPWNYGFIPLTLAQDGDPLDVVILCSEGLLPMSTINVKPIGVLWMVDSGDVDEKIIGVPVADPSFRDYNEVEELPKHIFDEMAHFFTVYKELEGKVTSVDKFMNAEKAREIIGDCMRRYDEAFKK